MPIIFDGPTKTITLSSGETQVAAGDIYSRWKDWVALSDNAKYLPAFRTIGGDPLSAIINAGSYFFLRNDLGWRMKPPEEDITIYLSGNFVAQDSLIDAIIPTTGAFTASIIGLQPVTQGVVPQMQAQLEFGSFQGAVWVNQSSGLSGTGYTVEGEPIGNASNPVNNFPDAKAIADSRGLSTMRVQGSDVLDTGDDVSNFKLVGDNAARTMLTINPASDTLGLEITEATINGTLDGITIIRECNIMDLNYFNGFLFQCMINGTITLGAGAQANILSCFSGVPGASTPTFDLGGAGQSLALRDYNGGALITNKNGPESCSIDLVAGQVKIDLTTVTNGTIVVRGTGKVINAADGDILPTGNYGGLNLINETTFGRQLQELWQLEGLDPDQPLTDTPTSRTAGDISIQVTGDGVNTSTAQRL